MIWIKALVSICTIALGGYVDYKKREIPDMVPVILLMTGLLGENVLFRFLSMLMVAAALLLTQLITKEEFPGGDFKLICALTFSIGPVSTAMVMILAGAGALLVSLIMKKPLKRNIPLCTYAAPAYILTCAANLLI